MFNKENELIMKSNKLIKLGIILIILSGIAFALMLIFPFLHFSNKVKAIGSTSSFIAMEVLFWTGGLLTGKELIKKYKSKLNPKTWFLRKSSKKY